MQINLFVFVCFDVQLALRKALAEDLYESLADVLRHFELFKAQVKLELNLLQSKLWLWVIAADVQLHHLPEWKVSFFERDLEQWRLFLVLHPSFSGRLTHGHIDRWHLTFKRLLSHHKIMLRTQQLSTSLEMRLAQEVQVFELVIFQDNKHS